MSGNTKPAAGEPSVEFNLQAGGEMAMQQELFDLATTLMPRYGDGWNSHSLLTIRRQSLSRFLHYDLLYRQMLPVPGVICEFGVQWGATLSQLISLRGIHEPYNHSRRIIGFDTFQGFVGVDEQDGGRWSAGDYSTEDGYETTLDRVLTLQEGFNPLSHIKKFELVKGDASKTTAEWLERNPHAIISMAILDMDVYRATRDVLELIKPRLTKGSVLVFDELSSGDFPGETLAVAEVLGLNNLSLRRSNFHTYGAWAVWGE